MSPADADPSSEQQVTARIGWLRAAVLGANDGVVSTTALMIGVAASSAERSEILTAGIAGVVAGAMSMAAGEYVSVSSQRDAERAEVAREIEQLTQSEPAELEELTQIYVKRGLTPELAREVARQLHAHDKIGAHLRDEHGLFERFRARPLQAALVSVASFTSLSCVPAVALLLAPQRLWIESMAGAALVALAGLGALGGRLGGAPPARAAFRVLVGGALAMGVSAGIGRIVGLLM